LDRGFDMKKYILACVVCAAALARSADPVLESVEAHQRYPWNGLVDIDVTMSGASNDVVSLCYTFVATNSATAEVLPVAHVTAIPGAIGSDTTWTRRFVWDATADAGTVKIDGIDLSVIAAPGIQLWENGPCWAACNVGASEPEGYGYYFWWGDTVGCKRNAADTRWVKVNDETKFLFIDENCPTYGNDKSELQSAGWIDSTGKLVPAHDAATAYLGGSWRMPTSAEIKYLVDHCSSAWTTNNGVYGRLVTGLGAYASQSIFLPAAGNIFQSARDDDGVEGWYWSSTLFGDSVDPEGRLAFFVNFRTSDSVSWIGYNGGMRYCGGSVRPVLENPTVQRARVSFAFDGRKGERDSPSGQEVLRYSSRWNVGTNDAPTVTLRENGNLLAAGLTGEGGYDWTVPSNGTYVLTHTTYTGGVVVAIETACYRIPHGLYDIDLTMVVASPYAGTFDGLPHGISVTGPEGTAVKYCATPNGVYGEDNPVFRDVCNTQVWYEISGEGYAPYTNAAAVVISPRTGVTVTITGHVNTVVYTGAEQSVGGYDANISDGLYEVGSFSFNGSAKAVGTAVGVYPMNLSESQFANTNGNFEGVSFVVADGRLEIQAAVLSPGNDPWHADPSADPTDSDRVKDPAIAFSPWDYVDMYDGAEHTFDTNAMALAYTETFGGVVPAFSFAWTSNGLFGAEAPCFKDVVATSFWYKVTPEGYGDVVHPCKVVITNRPVTVTSGTKLDIDYDGMPHVYASLAVTAGSFVAGEGIATSNWATVTEGQVPNTFDYGPLEGTKLGNYSLSIVTGEIAVVDRRLRVEFMVGEYGARSGGGALEQYIFSGAAAEAPEVTAAEGYRFTGWDVPFDVVTNALTVMAQYKAVAPEMFPGETSPLDASVDNTFNGFLYDEIGILAGVVQAKTGKAGRDGSVSVSASVTWSADGKKLSLKGTMPSDKTEIALEDKKGTGTLTLRFRANGLSGTWKCSSGVEWTASGARNVFTAKDADSRSSAETAAQKYAGVWTVGFDTGAGWSVFSVVLDPKGKAKIAGTLADGKKVSGTSTLVVGADTACVPVSLPKAGIAYALWLSATGAVVKASDVVAAGTFAAKAGALSADAAFGIDVGTVTNACAEYARHHASEVDADGTCALCPYLPNGVAVEVGNKGKWGVPKAGKVAYARGTTDIDETKLGENPSGLKLTYQAKTGLFNGSFKLYYVNGSGKVASQTATITGALIGGKGYGTAVIKKWNLRFPVTVGAE